MARATIVFEDEGEPGPDGHRAVRTLEKYEGVFDPNSDAHQLCNLLMKKMKDDAQELETPTEEIIAEKLAGESPLILPPGSLN